MCAEGARSSIRVAISDAPVAISDAPVAISDAPQGRTVTRTVLTAPAAAGPSLKLPPESLRTRRRAGRVSRGRGSGHCKPASKQEAARAPLVIAPFSEAGSLRRATRTGT
jgi:hypothetical protein